MVLHTLDAVHAIHGIFSGGLVLGGRHRTREPHDAVAALHVDVGRLHVLGAEQFCLDLGGQRAVVDMLADGFRRGRRCRAGLCADVEGKRDTGDAACGLKELDGLNGLLLAVVERECGLVACAVDRSERR